MNIKDRLLAYMPAQDKLGHFFVGAVAATSVALIVMATAALHFDLKMPGMAIAGVISSVLTALVAGVVGEKMDKKANDDAASSGEQPVHAVSKRDVVATALGAAPVALPLLLMLAMTAP